MNGSSLVRQFIGDLTVHLFTEFPKSVVRWSLEDNYLTVHIRVDGASALKSIPIPGILSANFDIAGVAAKHLIDHIQEHLKRGQ